MPRTIPAYRQRKGYDQALVTLRDAVTKRARDYWLGPYNTPQSRELYCRVIADWEANGRRLIDPPQSDPSVPRSITIVEVSSQYLKWAEANQGEQDVSNVKLTIRVLTQMWGTTEAIAFGPSKLRKVRDQMIRGDATAKPPRRPWSRPYINVQVQRIISMFKWAASHELLPVTTELQQTRRFALFESHGTDDDRLGARLVSKPDQSLQIPDMRRRWLTGLADLLARADGGTRPLADERAGARQRFGRLGVHHLLDGGAVEEQMFGSGGDHERICTIERSPCVC